jgi:hypothetical protein
LIVQFGFNPPHQIPYHFATLDPIPLSLPVYYLFFSPHLLFPTFSLSALDVIGDPHQPHPSRSLLLFGLPLPLPYISLTQIKCRSFPPSLLSLPHYCAALSPKLNADLFPHLFCISPLPILVFALPTLISLARTRGLLQP